MQKPTFTFIAVYCCFFSPLNADVVEDIGSHWENDAPKIVAADLKLRVIRSHAKPGTSIVDFDRIISELGEAPSSEQIGTALKPLVDQGQKEIWGVVDWTIEGEKVRETIQSEGELISTKVFNGKQRVDVMHQNRQINIGAPRRSRTIPLSSLYFVPPADVPVTQVTNSDGTAELETADGNYSVDVKTGFVKMFRSSSKRVLQFNATEFPGDICFPSAAITAQVKKDGTIGRVFAFLVDGAVFNQTIAEDKFVVSGVKDDKVFDYRLNPDNPVGEHLTFDLPDVTDFVAHPEADPVPSLAKGIGNYIPGLLVTAFIGVMIVRFRHQ